MKHTEKNQTKKTAMRLPSPGVLLVIIFLSSILLTATASAYALITDQIIENAIANMEELAHHDEQAILTSLNHQWNVLDGIGQNLRQQKVETTHNLLLQLNLDRNMLSCIRLALLSQTGETLSSNMNVSRDNGLFQLCQDSGEHFVYRWNNTESAQGGRNEVLLLGVEIKPFTVDGRTFTHLVALMDIDSLRDELRIVSFDGRGFASVIDEEGEYVVQMGRSYTTEYQENFFQMLQVGQLADGTTVGQIRNRIRSQDTFSTRYIDESGDTRIFSFTPMAETNWYFIMSVSRSVFEEQSRSLFIIIAGMLIVVIAVIIASVIFLMHRRSVMLRQEIQHRKALAEALDLANQANRAKTAFLSNMSHDIRTPMNAIIGFTTLATNNADNPRRVRDYLEKIQQSSSHLLSLINDVLDMSRIESGKFQLNPKPENLPEILHYLRNIIQADIQTKQLSLRIDTVNVIHEDVICDRLRMNQLLLNLLSNAVKYTPDGGEVTVRITETQSSEPDFASFQFQVQDTGIGMSPEYLKTIFEPFTRERNSTVSGIQGTGLGMAITKSIVDMMNGSIRVTSEPGKGSNFVVELTFPIPQDAHAHIGVIEDLKGMRALVVDDDPESCQSVCQMLEKVGMRPASAQSGEAAVAAARKAIAGDDGYAVFILDWQMPDITGLETAAKLRELPGFDARIIAFSAYDWADISEDASDVGISEFVSKPLFASELYNSLLRVCVRREEQRDAREDQGPLSFKGKRILLAEDNKLNREIAIEILSDVGFEIDAAENGLIAYEMLRDSQPGYYNLVLMDVQMPVMDGHTATREIRKLKDLRLSEIPIIAMTANAFEEDKRAALDAGMDGHLGKPLDVPLLMDVLRNLFGGTQKK